jgi:hypothetical protein
MPITNNQETRYLIDRIFVNSYSIIDSSLFADINDPTGTIDFTYSNATKNDMYRIMRDVTSDYLLIELSNTTIIIDCTNKTYAYCIFKFNGGIVNVLRTTDFGKVFPTTFIGSAYISIKRVLGDGNIPALISSITAHNFSPQGNMYIITDYDDSLVESTFLDIIYNILN